MLKFKTDLFRKFGFKKFEFVSDFVFRISNFLVQSTRSQASVQILIPDHLRRLTFIPVSCYAFFKRWLLLSQLPGCLKDLTSFNLDLTLGP